MKDEVAVLNDLKKKYKEVSGKDYVPKSAAKPVAKDKSEPKTQPVAAQGEGEKKKQFDKKGVDEKKEKEIIFFSAKLEADNIKCFLIAETVGVKLILADKKAIKGESMRCYTAQYS